MNLSRDESRALSFIALVLALSAGVRLIDRPRPVSVDAAGVDLNALEAASRAAGQRPVPLAEGERIDPNTASLDELLRLPRMRRTVAEAVIRMRATTRFGSLADLDRVPGVGPTTLNTWAPHLTLPALPARQATAPSPARPPAGAPVALNRATAEELETLPGIGPALAARILAWRDSAGGFRTLDDLAKVRGIGPATLARLKPLLALEEGR